MVLPSQIYESIVVLNWPIAAVQGMVLLAITLVIVFIFNQLIRRVYRAPQVGEV
jgi:ABC-type sulfate transport system permease component